MQAPFARILAAVMRGNAEVAGQTQAKKVASDQMDANAKTKVTMEANPNGGPPIVTFKGPADLLNQTQDSDVEKAYATPKLNVEKSLRERGFVPEDPHVFADPTSIDSFRERYSARRKLGGGVITSAIMAGATGSHRDDALRSNRANQVAAQNSATFQKFVKPVMDEEQDEAQLAGAASATREVAAKRRSDLIAKVATFVPGTDPTETLASVEQQLGGFRAGEREQATRALQTGRVSFVGDRVRLLAGAEGEAAIQGYAGEEVSRFVADQVGVSADELTESERNRVVSIFAAQQEKKRKREAEERRKEEDQRLQVAREQRMEQLALDIKQGRVDQLQANIENKKFRQAQSLSKQYDGAVQGFRDLDKRFDEIAALAAKANSATDIALLYSYMKALDSDSVVRESEFATASGIGSALTRMRQTITKAYNGERLVDKNRKAIVDAVGTLREAGTKRREQVKDFYRKKAVNFKIDPSFIGYDIGAAELRWNTKTQAWE